MVALHTLFYHYLNLLIHLILSCYVLALVATVVSASADENSAGLSAASTGATEYRRNAWVLRFLAVVRLLSGIYNGAEYIFYEHVVQGQFN